MIWGGHKRIHGSLGAFDRMNDATLIFENTWTICKLINFCACLGSSQSVRSIATLLWIVTTLDGELVRITDPIVLCTLSTNQCFRPSE